MRSGSGSPWRASCFNTTPRPTKASGVGRRAGLSIGYKAAPWVSFRLAESGRAIAHRARGFGVELIAYDPYVAVETAESKGVQLVGKEEILARSDYLMMQAPMTSDTHHFLGEQEFSQLKEGAIIVNTG